MSGSGDPIGLFLGMYLNPDRDCKTDKQKRFGLEFRDKLRCLKLEEILQIKAVTLNKDNSKKNFHHIQHNFNSSKGLLKCIIDSFPSGDFKNLLHIFLDYFHSPV